MAEKYVCVGCAKCLPDDETTSSLVSLKFGWRLRRGRDANGATMSEWRCPDCWQTYKTSGAALPGSDDLTTDVSIMRPIPAVAPAEEKPSTVWSWVTPWRKSGRNG